MTRSFCKLGLLILLCLAFKFSYANESQTSFKLNFAHYDRNFESTKNNRTQTGTGIVVRHHQSLLSDQLEIKAGLYAAQKWSATGLVREDLFSIEDDQLDGFELLGEASVAWLLNEKIKLEIGRFEHNSLLLKSKTRVLPSTFQGANATWSPSDMVRVYGHRFTKWSRRASPNFDRFKTNASASGAISSISILGIDLNRKLNDSLAIELHTELLDASDYLRKLGVVGVAHLKLSKRSAASFKGGLFVSRDSGALFINGANDALDIDQSVSSESRLEHRGFGYYLSSFWSLNGHRLGLSYVQFTEPWLEDSFADDHGTTPFPSRTYGPDLTNANERVWVFEYRHQWRAGILNGLDVDVAYANGSNIENSVSASLGQAKESWYELDAKYQPPMFENLTARLRYRDYDSDINGEVEGVASPRNEARFTISYEYQF